MTERLELLINTLGYTIRGFEEKIGSSFGVFNKSIKKKTDIQSKWIKAIADNFPQVNIAWLITGKGEMFLENNVIEKIDVDLVTVEILQKQLAEKDKQIAVLLEILARK